MERFVRYTAPTGKIDFVVKLIMLIFICGLLNHLQDFVANPVGSRETFYLNLIESSFTAIPMCTGGLILIAHLHTLQRQLYRQATTDQLTQLRNRRWFMTEAAHIAQGKHALIMLDIDHFKKVNDTYGHDSGDLCLQIVAQHLRSCLRDGDICARLGGEEFAVMLRNANQASIHEITTNLCCGVLYQPIANVSQRVTISAGVAMTGSGFPLSHAMRQADVALYQAKAKGRARYEWIADPRKQTSASEGQGDPQRHAATI